MAKNLTIEEAMILAMEGWQIRRTIWADAGITGQVLPPGAIELRWIRYHRGATWHDNAYWIQSATISDRIVLATDVVITDVDALDWTTDPPELPTGVEHTTWTDPNAPLRAGGSTGARPSGTGVPGSGGGSVGETGISGGGSSAGGGGGASSSRRSRPTRTAPALTVTVSRTTAQTCVARDVLDQITPGPVTDTFAVTVALAADPAGAPGALWHFSARWGCGPAGPGAIFMHGTLAPGASQDGEFSVTSPAKGAAVVVTAVAYLPLSPLVSSGRDTSSIRVDCAPGGMGGCTDPMALNFDAAATFNDGSCILPIPGCTNPAAYNYNPSANTDDGSCILSCPSGEHWDGTTCVPDGGGGDPVCADGYHWDSGLGICVPD